MGKQPYIPFYVGDYLKDTRVLPLAVRGAWVDLILFMWDAPVRGEITGTLEDFARLMSCEKSEAEFALNLLKQKSTADFCLLSTGEIKIVSRKMKRDADISKKRSEAGKNGVEAKKSKNFASANKPAKGKQITEYDIEYESENEVELKETDFSISDDHSKDEIFDLMFADDRWATQMKIAHAGKDMLQAWNECYTHHMASPNPPNRLFLWRQKLNTWLTIKTIDKPNGTKSSNKKSEHTFSLAESFAKRHSS